MGTTNSKKYTLYACLDHPVDCRGPNSGRNSIKTGNEEHIKLVTTGGKDFL